MQYAFDQIAEIHPGDFHVNIHQATCRSIAASLAFGRVPLEQIVLAGLWKSSSVFTGNSLRSLANYADNLYGLGLLVAFNTKVRSTRQYLAILSVC